MTQGVRQYVMKKSIIESIIIYSVIPLMISPVIICIYLENEIDQLGKAFTYGPKYTFIPFFILFLSILYPICKDLKIALKRSLQFSLIYSLLAVIPILLVNNNYGRHQDITISGLVVEMKPGRGKSMPEVTVKNEEREITFRLAREKWSNISVGEYISLKAKIGSFGLIYN